MSLRRELARKLLHISTAVVPVAYAARADRGLVGGALLALLGVALAVEAARRSARGAAWFARTTGVLLREHEHAGAWAGATWLLFAFLVAVALFPRDVAVAAMLGVSLGDAAGAVVGRWWSERRAMRAAGVAGVASTAPVGTPSPGTLGIPSSAKTWAGTAACALATTVGALLVARLPWWECALAGVLAATAERPRIRFDDNLRIVLAVAIGILLCRLAFS
jgi:dolichol kinase